MECLGGGVNRMVCGMGWSGVDWIGKGDGSGAKMLSLVGFGRVKTGLRRLCVVCATTGICCICNKSIQNHAPG